MKQKHMRRKTDVAPTAHQRARTILWWCVYVVGLFIFINIIWNYWK